MLGFPEKNELEPLDKLGRYTIVDKLGKGASGNVYKAHDPFVQRHVAIKVFKNTREHLTDESADQETSHFLREAHIAGQLHHPNIVALYDVGLQGSRNYIVMEYVEGYDLHHYCKEGNRLPIAKCIDVMFKCCDALDYAHNKKVIHRDIKPANILLDEEGTAKITDFNIAESSHSATTIESGLVGSPAYMSPELIEGKPVSVQADIYSLGVVLYQLLTGKLPFEGDSTPALMYAIVNNEPPSLLELRPGLPARIEDIVMKCLNKDTKFRYQSCKELAGALTHCFTDLRFNKEQIADVEKRKMLKSVGNFAAFGDSEIDELLQIANWLSFMPGQNVVEEGEIDSAFYVIVKGEGDVTVGDQVVGHLGVGDCFGEVGVFNKGIRTATVTAKSFMLTMKLSSSMVDQLSPHCQLSFYKMFVEILINRQTKSGR